MGLKDLPILEVTFSSSAGLEKLIYREATLREGVLPASQNPYPGFP